MESEREGWENKEEVEVEMRWKKKRGGFFFYVERGGVFIGSILGKVRNKNRRAKDQSGAMKRDGIRETSREGK